MTTPLQPGPCSWPFATDCAPGWAELPAAVQSFAQKLASYVLWSFTGRRYGLCEVVIRPCQWAKCSNRGLPPGGWWWSDTPWIPRILDGVWVNSCPCEIGTFCSCELNCSVRLPGPVSSVTEVKVDGVVIDPAEYAVYDFAELKRLGGECWPICQDFEVGTTEVGSFVVTYQRGVPAPESADCVTGLLAAEIGKACTGKPCRLPRNVQSVARQGVNVSFLTPEQLQKFRMTGIPEVDLWVTADNPDRLTSDSVVWSPETRRGRQRTS